MDRAEWQRGAGDWHTPSNWNLGVVPNNFSDGNGDGVPDILTRGLMAERQRCRRLLVMNHALRSPV